MSKMLFIDANIYLRFFDTNSSNFKKLLQSILEIQDKIFITQQIRNETERNKLDIFFGSFKGYLKQFNLCDITLPEHLDKTPEIKIKEWNVTTNGIADSVKNQKKELDEITEKLLENVKENKDEVSIVLSQIFARAKQPSEDQLNRARIRKELGNPPGKRTDPLGDQISWEQLLDEIPILEAIWIISHDEDFFTTYKEKSYLNPVLNAEIKSKKDTINIFCFKTLSDGLKSFKEANILELRSLPNAEQLEEISEEERSSSDIRIFLPVSSGYSGSSGVSRTFSTSGYSGYAGSNGYEPPRSN